MTQTFALAIVASFLFLQINLLLKLTFGIFVTVFYSVYIWTYNPDYFAASETWNLNVKPHVAHIMSIVFLTFTLHLVDRQTEYMNRLDFQWKQQLVGEQEEASNMHIINNMLLRNILPIHVAEIYLNTNRQSNELYHEQYKSVAVMFASIVDYTLGSINEILTLNIMNQIICDFDKLLMEPSGHRIEKIKVARWTYMAACGLDPGRKDSNCSVHKLPNDNIAVLMVQFAVDMMKVLNNINRETQQTFKLRIGISHGEVTAGVVGSKKPLYDIWGDAVNMASRMDSTGEPWKIHVTENTARVLEKQGIKCNYRKMTFVKGIGEIPTYYVCLDHNYKLIAAKQTERSV